MHLKPRLDVQDYVDGISKGDRVILAKAITLAESRLPTDRRLADKLLERTIPNTGNSIRIGITGAPGVGKSTFIEAFGRYVIQAYKKKIAVLTVDPSSQLTKGSILGDKTRMEELAKDPLAFIRPSSSGEALGGVTNRTREAIHLCEAAGFEIIIVETVGVGQSETEVRKIVDFFVLLILAGAGDELQGIKKGIMEMADVLVITKADGDNKKKAIEAQAEYQHALHLFRPDESGWTTKVLTCSAFNGEGINTLWETLENFQKKLKETGYFEKRRQQQQVSWMYGCFEDFIRTALTESKTLSRLKKKLEGQVLNYEKSPQQAAHELAEEYIGSLKSK